MLKTSARLILSSLAAGSLLTVAAPAMAYDHLLSAFDFIDNAVVNDTGNYCVIDWTVGAYTGHTLGAGFFIATLADAQGWVPSDVYAHWGMNCPSSPLLYNAIGTGTYFTQVTTAVGIQVGDVLVINSTTGAAGTYSGHTVMIREPPTVRTSINPLIPGTTQWALKVTDSTTAPHGCSDTRYTPGLCTPAAFHAGAGDAEMRIYTNTGTGNLAGYTWSNASTSTYYAPAAIPPVSGVTVTVRPYRVGTFTGLKNPAPAVE